MTAFKFSLLTVIISLNIFVKRNNIFHIMCSLSFVCDLTLREREFKKKITDVCQRVNCPHELKEKLSLASLRR